MRKGVQLFLASLLNTRLAGPTPVATAHGHKILFEFELDPGLNRIQLLAALFFAHFLCFLFLPAGVPYLRLKVISTAALALLSRVYLAHG